MLSESTWEGVAIESQGVSPSSFDKDHFRYDDDSMNYFRLYEELMLNEDVMAIAAVKLSDVARRGTLTYRDVARETFVSKDFFNLFPGKLDKLNELILEKLN
jgi:hypothetical protein